MRIYEVNLPKQIVAILNEINSDFETQFKELENLVDYIESGKCPWIDDIWLSKLKTFTQRYDCFLEN